MLLFFATTGLIFAVPNADCADINASIEQTHQQILSAVENGQLSAQIGERANNLRREYKKYLIQKNAQIQILKIDVLEGPAEIRQKTLDDLTQAVSEMEQVKIKYLQQFKQLGGGKLIGQSPMKTTETVSMAPPQEPTTPLSKEPNKSTGTKWRTVDTDVVIEVQAEDLTNSEFD